MESIEARRRATNKIIDDIEEIGKSIEKKSYKIQNGAIDIIIDKSESTSPFVLNSLVALQIDNSIRKLVIEAEDSFEDVIKKTQKYLAQGYKIELSKENLKAIAKTQSTIIDKLINNTNILKSDIKLILYSNLGRGIPKRQLIKLLKDLYPKYSRNAGTIINTGLAREFQDINTTKFQERGFNWYIWAGPDDSLTREFPCKHWVNHKFTASQLDILRTTRQSLWNCRHSILPLTDEEAKDYPDGDISFAI